MKISLERQRRFVIGPLPGHPRYAAERVLLPPDAHEFVSKSGPERISWMKYSTPRIRSKGILAMALRIQSGYVPSTTAGTRLARQQPACAGIWP
jgi:hypothetical protein